MLPRFYVPAARAQESSLDLPADEAAHLTRVLRMSVGDHIRVFNGRGEEWDAVVDVASKERVTARLGAPVAAAPESRVKITLAMAVLKGDKMDDVVRDAVMLGAFAIQPFVSTRTEISRSAIERSRRVERWQRIAIASTKQCGRAVVPEVKPAMGFEDAVHAAKHPIMLVEPSAAAGSARLLRELPPQTALTLVVGPEGGWTEEEVQWAHANGTMLLTLGAHTLRADAVPIVALTALRVRMEDF